MTTQYDKDVAEGMKQKQCADNAPDRAYYAFADGAEYGRKDLAREVFALLETFGPTEIEAGLKSVVALLDKYHNP